MTTNAASEVIERVEYTYDAFDRRITRDVERFNQLGQPVTERTAYLWNDGQVQLELTSNGKITFNYFHGPDSNEILATDQAVIDGAATTWLLADTTGAIRTLVHEQTTGDWNVVHRLFDSFGEPTPRPNATGTVDPSLLGDTNDAVLSGFRCPQGRGFREL